MNVLRSPLKLAVGPGEDFGSAHAGLLLGRQAAGVDRLGNQRRRHAQVEGVLAHPFAGPLLLGRVEDLVDQVIARFAVLHGENVARDLDQVAFQLGLVPGVEDVVQLVVGKADGVLEQEIGFADELHVAVFDAVVDHLDVMAGARLADPFAAGNVVLGSDLGADGLQDRLDVGPGGRGAAGHDAGAFQGPLFASGNARADVEHAGRIRLLWCGDWCRRRACCRRRSGCRPAPGAA